MSVLQKGRKLRIGKGKLCLALKKMF